MTSAIMKRLFLSLFVLIIALPSQAIVLTPKKPEAPKRQGELYSTLYGDVESLVITYYNLHDKFGELVKGDMRYMSYYKFNEKGDVIEMMLYNSDGTLYSKDIYKYNAQGAIAETSYYNANGAIKRKVIYKYDSLGNNTERAEYNSDGSLNGKEIYKYDNHGNRTEEATFKSDGSLSYKYLSCYDAQGRIIDKTYYRDSKAEMQWHYKYDSAGNWAEWICYYEVGGNYEWKNIMEYDADGNLLSEVVYDINGLRHHDKYSDKYVYDSYGNMIEHTTYLIDAVVDKCLKKYDSHGNVIEEILFKTEAMIPSYITEYKIEYR